MDWYGISKLNLKLCNRRQILRLIRTKEPISRVEISEALGLTRAAVTIITNEMIEEGILQEAYTSRAIRQSTGRGRKRVNLNICPNFKFVFGVVVEQDLISIGLTNLNGEVLGKRYFDVVDPRNLTDVLTSIIGGVRKIIEESCLNFTDVLALGLCVHSSLACNSKQGDLNDEISSTLENELGISVYFDELCSGLALAEVDFGCRKQGDKMPKSLVCIHYGPDVTASVVPSDNIFDDDIIKPAGFGHMICETEGEPCPVCGRTNCIHGQISVSALEDKINSIYSKSKTPNLYKLLKDQCDSPGKSVLSDSKLLVDDKVAEIIAMSCKWFAIGISNTITMLNSERLVLFGKVFENTSVKECMKSELTGLLPKEMFSKLKFSEIPTRSIFLAGCSVAIKSSFINSGGYNQPT